MNSYSISIQQLTVSSAADGDEKVVEWDQIKHNNFFHIHIIVQLPTGNRALESRYQKIAPDGTPIGPEINGDHIIERGEGRYELIFTHYTLESNFYYLIKVADEFSTKTRCLSSQVVKTI